MSNDRCKYVEKSGYHCGSFAMNLHRDEGINQGELCDRHYWQSKHDSLKAINADLMAACKAIIAWDDAENNAPPYDSDNGAHWRMRQALCVDAFDKARAAIDNHESQSS